MTHRTLYSLFFCLLTASILAQKPADLKRNGEKAFDNGRWTTAKTLLAQYQEAKPGDFDVLTKLGISLYQLGQGVEARRYLEYVSAKQPNSQSPELYYYLANTLHGLAEWDKAIAAYKTFLRTSGDKNSLRANAAENIRRCVYGMRISENPEIALVENLGALVNSPGDEFAPLPSVNYADRLYYAAAREGCNGGQRNEDGLEDLERGQWSSDMFATKLSISGWEAAGGLGGLLNSSRFEVPLGFNADGQVLYFFRGFSTFSGEILADTAAKKDEYALQAPSFKSPVQPEEGDNSPYFVNDNTIIFASRRAGGQGGLDLWYTVFADTAWTEPINMGPTINTAYDETTPFLARDGRTLYFSSNRAESMGGLDVYSAVFDDKKIAWQEAANLGIPVNSPGDDAFYRLSSDGKAAFFSSNRFGGYGERDLYIAYFKEVSNAQTTRSKPELFCAVGKDKSPGDDQIKAVVVPAILYDKDSDILSIDNQKVLELVAKTARQHVETTVLATVFTDNSGQSKFDLYYGIKRAEIIGKALTDRGITANRIILRSVGASYPIARTILDGAENLEGKRLNKRVELTFTALDPLAFDVRMERPPVSELMATEGAKRLDQQTQGLAFKVEAVVTRQILTSDALAMFDDMVIESQPGTGAYHYTVGYFKQYDKALSLRKELQGLGFTEARVLAYINGIQVSKAEAVGLMKKYPDIAGFIKG